MKTTLCKFVKPGEPLGINKFDSLCYYYAVEADSGQFCPVCKFLIQPETKICPNCGQNLIGADSLHSTTIQLEETEARQLAGEQAIDQTLLPDRGVAVYTYKEPKLLIAVQEEKEFILGRRSGKTGSLSESVLVDLGPLNGFELGASRRHALISRKEMGYVVTDLESTNGTWLNGQRLVPNHPYELKNGSLIRVGKMLLYIVYRPDIGQ
jgi:hypothetical protein